MKIIEIICYAPWVAACLLGLYIVAPMLAHAFLPEVF